jgi:hypothetical protein
VLRTLHNRSVRIGSVVRRRQKWVKSGRPVVSRSRPLDPRKQTFVTVAVNVRCVPIGDIGRLVSPLAFPLLMDTSAASVSSTFGHNSFQGVAFGIPGAAI